MSNSAPLSTASRALLELGSEVPAPSAEQAERMRRALEPLFAEQMPSATALPRPMRAPTWAARGKLLLTLGALATTASTSFWLGRMSREAPREVLSSSPITATEEATRAPAALPNEQTSEGTRAPAAPLPSPARRHGAVAGRGKPALGLAAEIAWLTAVEAALRQGRAEVALRQLDSVAIHELVEQSAALRVVAECSLGRRHADRRAEVFLRRWPESAYRARVREACER